MKIGDVFFEKHTIVKMSSRDPEQWAEAGVEEVDAIEIPDNATNGDMIKKIFPNAEYLICEDVVNVTFCDTEENWFDKEWWNAPYKKGENNDR